MNRSYFLLFLISLFLTSCDPDALIDSLSETANSSTTLNIRLTDGPIDLEEVNIDLQQVFVKGPNGFEEIPLGTNAGIYNLLDFQNGKDVLIASIEELQLSQIKEIRLVLGDDNTVVVDGKTFDLKIPSGSQSGLKIKTCLDLTDTPEYDLLLDFDACASIHITGNGKYIMKPVIKVVNPDAKCKDDDKEDDKEDLKLEDLPENAVKYLTDNYDGYKFEIEQDTLCDGLDVYVVEAEKDEEEILLYFDLDGNFLQTATPISNEALPEIVIFNIGEYYSTYTLLDNETTLRIEDADGAISYQVLLQKDDEQLAVIYKEDGAFVCDQSISKEEEEDANPDDLPEAVKDLLSGTYAGYAFTSKKITFCDGTEVYLLEGNKGSNTILLYFDLDWNLLQSAKQFDEDKLPAEVVKSIKMDYSNYKIMNNKAWEITRADGQLWYRVYLKKNNSGEKFYVIYAEDGAFVCKE